jgi:hypothetical protein
LLREPFDVALVLAQEVVERHNRSTPPPGGWFRLHAQFFKRTSRRSRGSDDLRRGRDNNIRPTAVRLRQSEPLRQVGNITPRRLCDLERSDLS